MEVGKLWKHVEGSRARRLLVEGAQSYRYAANISTEMQKRQESLSKEVIDIAWKAQVRLCRRYQYLSKRGKNHNVKVNCIVLLIMPGSLYCPG